MHMTRRTLTWAALLLLCVACAGLGAALPTRIRDLKAARSAMIKARVGERVEAEEAPGVFVFTLRDDYGDTIKGRTSKDISGLRFGATYYLQGRRTAGAATGREYFEVASWRLTYGTHVPRSYFLVPVLLALLAAAVVYLVVSRRITLIAPPAWGDAEIVSGPDQGKLFTLKGRRVVVGRQQNPERAVSVVLDNYVSRQHGVLLRKGGTIYYEDTFSAGGSWLDEQPVNAGTRVAVLPGALLRLGPHTVIRVGRAPSEDFETRAFDPADLGYTAESDTHSDTGRSADREGR